MLTRKPFRSSAPARPQRADRSDEFASVPSYRPAAVMAPSRDFTAKPAITPKIKSRADKKIRDSAKGEACSVRIIGGCNSDPKTVVWSHLPGLDGDRGMGLKSLDLCGAYACACCHDIVDGRAPLPPGATRQSVMLDWHAGHMRSLVLLARKGLV